MTAFYLETEMTRKQNNALYLFIVLSNYCLAEYGCTLVVVCIALCTEESDEHVYMHTKHQCIGCR